VPRSLIDVSRERLNEIIEAPCSKLQGMKNYGEFTCSWFNSVKGGSGRT